ncbi:MAG: hypothetical protein E3K32_01935 [wastewater metagenome]|nr:hypothetical protein [Candidatus Loosdrechtia aerotolerans]
MKQIICYSEHRRLSMRPNFLVIGAMKSATTSLCELLGSHTDIFISKPKEPEYFCKDELYQRGWKWYESLFSAAADKTAIGEGSASYTKRIIFPQTAIRIARDLPGVKLIYIVRHPLERIESHWIHSTLSGHITTRFCDTLRQFPGFINTSLYFHQISAYREYFPDDRILVLFFEDFKNNPRKVLERCFRFLGVDPTFQLRDPEKPRNVSGNLVDTKIIRTMRQIPQLYFTKQLLLPGVIRPLKRVFQRRLKEYPQWDKNTLQWVVDQVAPDAHAFLRCYGKPEDYWKLERPTSPLKLAC